MIFIQEQSRNATEGYRFGEADVYETRFEDDEVGELFRFCQIEFGRCTSSVYVDRDGETQKIGWVFLKRCNYDDVPESFLQETRNSLHTAPPTRTIKYHYMPMAA
jgi:hypothetical protein